MNKIFYDKAWEDYLYFQKNEKKILQKINELIKDIERNGLLDLFQKYLTNQFIVSKK